jgi:hypothetical protein
VEDACQPVSKSIPTAVAAPTHSDFLFIESENSLGQSIFDPTELNHQGLKCWRGDWLFSPEPTTLIRRLFMSLP